MIDHYFPHYPTAEIRQHLKIWDFNIILQIKNQPTLYPFTVFILLKLKCKVVSRH